MSDFTKLAKEVVKIAKTKRDKKPSSFDTEGKVNRIDRDNKIAWVKFAEGEDETPVQMTIDVVPGDWVTIRESGHKARISGNVTHPPGDATGAVNYVSKIVKGMEARMDSGEFKGDPGEPGEPGQDAPQIVKIESEWCFSTTRATFTQAPGYDWQSTVPEYVSGLYYYTRTKTTFSDGSIEYSTPILDLSAQVSAESELAVEAARQAAEDAQTAAENAESEAEQAATDAEQAATDAADIRDNVQKHFWFDTTTGAHVSETENDYTTGTSANILNHVFTLTQNGKNVASFGQTSMQFYDGRSVSTQSNALLASFSRTGVSLYSQNRDDSPSVANTRRAAFTPSGITLYANKSSGSGTIRKALFNETSVNFYDRSEMLRANFGGTAINFYDGSSTGASSNDLVASYSYSGVVLYAGGSTSNRRSASFTSSGVTFWDTSDTTVSASQRKEAIFGADGVHLYGIETDGQGVYSNPEIASFTTSGISFNTNYDMTVGDANRYIKWKKNTQSLEIVTDSLYIGGNPVQPTSVGPLVRYGYTESTWLQFANVGYSDQWDNRDYLVSGTGPEPKIPYPIAKDSTITIAGYASDSGNYWNVIVRVTADTSSGYIPGITISAESNPRGESGGTTDSQYMTYDSSFGLRVYSGPKTDPSFANAYTQIKSDGITLVRNNNNSPQQIAKFGATAIIGDPQGPHFSINANSLYGYSGASTYYFKVSSTELKYGNYTAANTSDVTAAKTAAITDANSHSDAYANGKYDDAVSYTNGKYDDAISYIDTKSGEAGKYNQYMEFNQSGTYAGLQIFSGDKTSSTYNKTFSLMKSDGLHIYNNLSGTTTQTAFFGASAQIGQSSSNHLLINSSAISFYKDANYRSFWLEHTASSTFKQCLLKNYSIENDSSKSKNEITVSSGKAISSGPDTASINLRSTSTASYYGEVNIFGGASDGYVEIKPKLIIGGHSSEIGSIITATNTKSIATTSSFVTSGCSLTIPAGSWVICYGASWAEDSTTTSGRRAVELYTSSSVSYTRIVTPAGISSDIQQRGAFPVNRSSSTTYYVYVLQNSGKSISCTANIYAIRVA